MLNVKPIADSLFLLFNPHFIKAFIHQSALKTETTTVQADHLKSGDITNYLYIVSVVSLSPATVFYSVTVAEKVRYMRCA